MRDDASNDKLGRLPLPVSTVGAHDGPQRKALQRQWSRFKRRVGTGAAPSESVAGGQGTEDEDEDDALELGEDVASFGRRQSRVRREPSGEEKGDVDEVVVDNAAEYSQWRPVKTGDEGDEITTPKPLSNDFDADAIAGSRTPRSAASRRSSFQTVERPPGLVKKAANFCRWRAWPGVLYFFDPSFKDPSEEEAYQREIWYTSKNTAIFGAAFLVVSWIFAVTLLPRPWSRWNEMQNYVLGPLFSLPLIPMAMFDFPRRKRWAWQLLLLACVYVSSTGNLIDMRLCGYYAKLGQRTCSNRDFLSTLYYASAFPVIALFSLGQTRIFSVCGAVAWIILVGVAILPEKVSFIRNVLNIALFQGFVLYSHYRHDIASRRLWSLRSELKVHFKAKIKAQQNERRITEERRRFQNYVWHELRVPLNTALLAVQNLEGAGAFDVASEHSVEYAAFSGSLQMMSQVLNDVLDFNRMERGGFTTVARPFRFHQVMRSIAGAARLDAEKRNQLFSLELDPSIDEAVAQSTGDLEKVEFIGDEGDSIVIGDEMRLRQVINNLASNAAKFTPSGGRVSIRTKLVWPTGTKEGQTTPDSLVDAPILNFDDSPVFERHTLGSSYRLDSDASADVAERVDVVVIRIEVEDTGPGIRPQDMVGRRLFSAYCQTEIGRRQGGKGTGLGLSLCRHIVLLSGGKLGVKSRVGVGSTFWVELPFFVGPSLRRSLSNRSFSKSTQDSSWQSLEGSELSSVFVKGPSPLSPAVVRDGPGDLIEMLENVTTPMPSPSPLPVPSPPLATPPLITPPLATPPLAATLRSPLLQRPQLSKVGSTASAPTLSSAKSTPTGRMEFSGGPIRVLTVDDDTLTRRLMDRMLSRLGCDVSQAENGVVALEMLTAAAESTHQAGSTEISAAARRQSLLDRNFDLVLLDNQMPLCTGPELVAQLRQLGRNELVVGVTANAQKSDQDEFLAAGASFVLTKPVSEADLRHFLVIADRDRTAALERLASRTTANQVVEPPPPSNQR